MLENSIRPPKYNTGPQEARKAKLIKWGWISLMLIFTVSLPYGLVSEALVQSYYNDVSASSAAWLVLIATFIAIIREPRYGTYCIMFFTLMGDLKLSWWLPFNKNFSSPESLLYVSSPSLPFSPLELCLVFSLGVWILRMVIRREYKFYVTELTWAVLAFTGFIVLGIVYGLSQGGAIDIALWESRAIFYLTIMFLLCSNTYTERHQYNILMWAIMLGLFTEGIIGNWWVHIWEREKYDSRVFQTISEHSASQHMNTMYVFLMASWVYVGGSIRKRLILPVMCIPVVVIYILSQRRAAFLTLGISFLFLAFVLYHQRRWLFWQIMPPLVMIALAYMVVFWNSSGPLAFPVQAVKSVIAEDDANSADRASNEYRDVENLNTLFTIQTEPLTGVGFGKKFYIAYQMPDISFFVWWEYITHNSIMWMWMKTGAGGFIAMIYMIGLAIMTGARVVWRMPHGNLGAIALTLTIYIIMHFIFAYVDMSWNDQSMLYIGASMGVLSSMERVLAKPVPQKVKRWPWQPDPATAAELRPLQSEQLELSETH